MHQRFGAGREEAPPTYYVDFECGHSRERRPGYRGLPPERGNSARCTECAAFRRVLSVRTP